MGKMYGQPHQLCDSNRRVVVDKDASFVRLYQVWDGNNRFFLGGRLIFGPDVRSLHHLGNLIVAIPVVLAAYIIVLVFLTSGRGPGIIPRNPHPPEPEDEGDSSGLSLEWAGNQSNGSTLPPTKDVLVNGTAVKVKYCHTGGVKKLTGRSHLKYMCWMLSFDMERWLRMLTFSRAAHTCPGKFTSI